MVGFWDSSALVPIYIDDCHVDVVRDVARRQRLFAVWWGTAVECVSSVARRLHRGGYTDDQCRATLELIGAHQRQWLVVPPDDAVRASACRLLLRHPVHAAAALQLAAALVVADGHPEHVAFYSLDDRLRDAAFREGFKTPF